MSNEEKAVLDFFAQAENLPLALSVAEQTDALRQQLNNAFWLKLQERIAALAPSWKVQITEDRNAPDCLVGLYLQPPHEQTLFLRPMMEQQMLGDTTRIYFGLMWSGAPTLEITQLAHIIALRDALQMEGFKNNESFLAWQWSPYHPRRRNFLLRFSRQPEALLDETAALLQGLLVKHGAAIQAVNAALLAAPRSAAVSLEQLRTNLKH